MLQGIVDGKGGGGGGGVLHKTNARVPPGNYSIVVGAGCNTPIMGCSAAYIGSRAGGSSSAFGGTVYGGGGGGDANFLCVGSGGNGGGGCNVANSAAFTTGVLKGTIDGTILSNATLLGNGASGTVVNPSGSDIQYFCLNGAGAGSSSGTGYLTDIYMGKRFYWGGGGGHGPDVAGSGGLGGGGGYRTAPNDTSINPPQGLNGGANTGGGGGGSNLLIAGIGGSGIVIVRVQKGEQMMGVVYVPGCKGCPSGWKVNSVGTCELCPANSSVVGSDCVCNDGYFGNGSCAVCNRFMWCSGGVSNACPVNSSSNVGAKIRGECVCNPGFSGNLSSNSGECTPCGVGSYQQYQCGVALGNYSSCAYNISICGSCSAGE